MKVTVIIATALIALLWPGCGTSETTKSKPAPPTDDFQQYIAENETTFHPEDFGMERWEDSHPESNGESGDISPEPVADVEPDTIPGFRVQVAITQEIESAGSLRDSLSTLLPREWIYVVYHPPYYKIRVGNYRERTDALSTLEKIRQEGYPDAWIVPDKILSNPPDLPPPDPGSPEGDTPDTDHPPH